MAEVLEPWADVVAEPEVLFRGGPVSPEGALAVGLLRAADDAPVGFRGVTEPSAWSTSTLRSSSWTAASTGCGSMPAMPGGAPASSGRDRRGQLVRRRWAPPDVFRDDTNSLWRDVLRRQPGQLAWHVTRPIDPEKN